MPPLLKKIMSFFNKNPYEPRENDSFIRLLQVMEEDDTFKKQVEKLIKMDTLRRGEVLDKIIEQMRSDKAPKEHIEVMQFIKDGEVCRRILNLMKT